MDTSLPRPSAIRQAAHFRPRGGQFPEWSLAVLLGLFLMGMGGFDAHRVDGAPPSRADASTWSHVVVVAAFHRVAATGIGGNATAQVLKRLGDYVESEVGQKGKAGLSIGLMVDATTAAKAAKWPAEDMARLVVALHRKFDPAQPEEWPKLQKVVERVRQGSPPEEILGTGDTLREPTSR
jgi:hypothetical protein